jgi:hypothetical protein
MTIPILHQLTMLLLLLLFLLSFKDGNHRPKEDKKKWDVVQIDPFVKLQPQFNERH